MGSSVVEHLFGMHRALSLILKRGEGEGGKEREKEEEESIIGKCFGNYCCSLSLV